MTTGLRVFLVVSAGAALLAAGAFLYSLIGKTAMPPQRHAQEDPEIEQRLARLDREIDRLRSQQLAATLGSVRNLEAPKSSEVGEEPATTEPSSRRPEVPSEDEARARVDARFAFLESEFVSQLRDAGWAQETEQKIAAGLRGADLTGVTVTKTVCASTMCRLDATLEDEGKVDDFFHTLTRESGLMSEKTLRKIKDGRGGATVIAYMAREGQSLPTLAD